MAQSRLHRFRKSIVYSYSLKFGPGKYQPQQTPIRIDLPGIYRSRKSSSWLPSAFWLVFLWVFSPNLCLLAGQQKESPFTTPVIQKVELLNGLHLLTAEIPGSDRVVINFLIKSGYGMDPEKKPGVAFLASHAILEANQKVASQRWKDELEFLEATFSIQSSTDFTLFHAEVPPKNVEPLLNTLANIVVHPMFQKEGLEQMKDKVGELDALSTEEFYSSLINTGLFGASYCAHRLLGSPETLKTIGLTDIEAFHATYYLPNNAAIIVAGPTGSLSLASLIREKFGSWTKGPQPPLPDPPISTLVDNGIHVFDKKGAPEITLLFANAAPSRQSPDYYSLVLLNQLLGASPQNSLLKQELGRHAIAFQSVDSEFKSGLVCGKLTIRALAPLSSIKPILDAIQQVIDGLKANKVAEATLDRVRLELLGEFQKTMSTPKGFAQQMVQIELQNLPRDLPLSFPRSLERISVDRLQEAAKNYLNPRGAVIVIGDKEKIEEVVQ
ncbi:MAG: pitrilysin family protein [Terriglobia bacterium]